MILYEFCQAVRGLVAAAVAVLGCALGPAFAHDIPNDIKVNAFMRPAGDRLELLMRIPMQALIEAIHVGSLPEERGHELTPVLFEVAEAGDDVAADIVRRQAREIVALVVAAIRRLDVVGEPIDVVLGGGVLTAGHPLLMGSIDALLHEAVAGATTARSSPPSTRPRAPACRASPPPGAPRSH